ncbi:glycosyltransferase [Saccharicrinis fermentans]|nr:glycosyltransferase [Saccharicrinis fermentans]
MDDNLAIVVPCYNEFERLPKDEFISFMKKNTRCKIVFSDDGSKDNTLQLLKEIKESCPQRIFINVLESNGGKAAAVRSGVLYCYKHNLDFDKIAFLDSDLATSLKACVKVSKHIKKI